MNEQIKKVSIQNRTDKSYTVCVDYTNKTKHTFENKLPVCPYAQPVIDDKIKKAIFAIFEEAMIEIESISLLQHKAPKYKLVFSEPYFLNDRFVGHFTFDIKGKFGIECKYHFVVDGKVN